MAREMTAAKLKGLHRHGCTNCHWRYDDANCDNPLVNGLCIECKTGLPMGFTVVIVDQRPHECCRRFARLATIEERERYSLGGDCAWFFCPPAQGGCALTHPYDDPKKEMSFDECSATASG